MGISSHIKQNFRKGGKEGLTNPLLFHGLFFLFNERTTLTILREET